METRISLRTRTLGWGYETTPTGRGTEIELPSGPDYVGTYCQIVRAIRADRAYQSIISGGTFSNTCWFVGGQRITEIWDGDRWIPAHDPVAQWMLVEDTLRRGLVVRTLSRLGRPPAAGDRRQGRVTITMPPEMIEALRARGNVSWLVRQAVDQMLAS